MADASPGCRVLLLGDPIGQSLSPPMQDAAFDTTGIACRYVLRPVTANELSGVIAEIRSDARILGANVTIPHKQAVIPILDGLHPVAARIGAVNTIQKSGGRLVGWNTDADGFARSLTELGFNPHRKVALLVGAGGAARAVAAVLQPTVSTLWIANRGAEGARRLWTDFPVSRGGPLAIESIDTVLPSCDLVVNATPVDIPGFQLRRPDQLRFDLRTRKSSTGRLMLLHQGTAAFTIWTGRAAPVDEMRAALEHAAAELKPV